ncbi:MAG: c-type cytochrome [Pseudomonadota bacterium]|nr:c-type cytochrome [Pseudomonadota bacterium]
MTLDRTGRIALLSLMSIATITTVQAEAPGEAEEHALPAVHPADQLLARLRYVRGDYAHAMEGGKIADAHEYEEQVELMEHALALASPLPLSTPTRTALGAILAAVKRQAPAAEVTAACDALLVRLADELWLEIDPPDPSLLAEGATLYGTNCASCHGTRGEGPAAELGLVPAPIAFADAAVAAQLSPRRIYEAVTFGVPETAMVPRGDTLSEPERWALAFYVAGFGTRGSRLVRDPVTVPSLTLEDLADATNSALASEAPKGVAPNAAVATWRGPLVSEAARSPWLEMRADTRAWADGGGRDALVRLRVRWEAERKALTLVNRRLAARVGTEIATLATVQTPARARDAARTLATSLAEVERGLR